MRDRLTVSRVMLLLAFVLAVLVQSCSRSQDPAAAPQLSAGSVVSRQALAQAVGPVATYLGDDSYAVVSSAALPGYYDSFRAEIFRQGVTKWDERFDCNHFATYYVALAQTRFYLEHFQSSTPAQTLAIGVYWYRPQAAKGGAHAVVIADTERGLVWIEPQDGHEFTPTDAEKMTVFLKAF